MINVVISQSAVNPVRLIDCVDNLEFRYFSLHLSESVMNRI